GEGAALVGVEDAGTYFTATTVEGALQELGSTTGSNAANVDTLVYYPEYPDAVIFQDGTNNRGTLEALYDDTNDEHYYNWASNQGTTQDIDIRFRFPLPADFVATGDLTFNYRTGTITEADNDVEIYVYNATDETTGNPTLCASDVTNTSANTWTTGIIAAATINTGCTGGTVLNAGDIVEIAIKLYDNTGTADFSDVGYLKLDYTN
ncbi:hypothetical protein KAR91_18775, partial [Candidatus Pacearchaeota archaeon]|nr:hypothetical protein [Candidatus Pacearchaeota archaeon]